VCYNQSQETEEKSDERKKDVEVFRRELG